MLTYQQSQRDDHQRPQATGIYESARGRITTLNNRGYKACEERKQDTPDSGHNYRPILEIPAKNTARLVSVKLQKQIQNCHLNILCYAFEF